MPRPLRNTLAVVAGFLIGGVVNMALIALRASLLAYLPMAWLAVRIGSRAR